MSNVTEKIQVLLSSDDMWAVNHILMKEALDNRERPIPLSSFVRNLIKEYIEEKRQLGVLVTDQRSFAKDEARHYLDEMKKQKTNSTKDGE